MNSQNNGQAAENIEDALDSLLSEEKGSQTDVTEKSVFGDLKAILLAVDWEISEDILQALDDQIERLRKKYREDRIIFMFLQLLRSITRYIRRRKADMHPDAIKLLNSVFNSLEIVSFSKSMANDERKRILIGEVEKFNNLKERLSSGNRKEKPVVEASGGSESKPQEGNLKIIEAVKFALEEMMPEIRKIIREEIRLAFKNGQ